MVPVAALLMVTAPLIVLLSTVIFPPAEVVPTVIDPAVFPMTTISAPPNDKAAVMVLFSTRDPFVAEIPHPVKTLFLYVLFSLGSFGPEAH